MTDQLTEPEAPQTPAKKQSIAHRLYTGEISYDFVGHRRRWYTISAVLLLISVLAISFRGLNWGIEFRGGADFQGPITVTSSTVEDVRSAVQELNLPGADEITVTLRFDDGRVETTNIDGCKLFDKA